MDDGWVKIWRKFWVWPPYLAMSPEQKVVTTTMIAMANWRDGVWFCEATKEAVSVPRGSFISTQRAIAKLAGVGRQVVRTTEAILSACHDPNDPIPFLTRKATQHYTLYSICKYCHYQDVEELSDPEVNPKSTQSQPKVNPKSTQIEEGIRRGRRYKKDNIPSKNSPKKPNAENNRGIALLQYYHDQWKELIGDGTPPAVRWSGADLNTAKQLLSGRTDEEAKHLIDSYLRLDDKWVAEEGYPISLIPTKATKILGRHKSKTNPSIHFGDPSD